MSDNPDQMNIETSYQYQFLAATYRNFLIGPISLEYEFNPEVFDQIWVGPNRFMTIFQNAPLFDISRAHICWGAIHICLFVYHARVHLTNTDYQYLCTLLDRFDPIICEYLDSDDVIYLFHSVVGHYGYLEIGQTFYFTILEFFHRMLNGDLGFDERLVLVVNFNHSELPHPFLQ